MEAIITDNYSIYFNQSCYKALNGFLSENKFSKIFLLVDDNTHEYCLPYFLSQLETDIAIEIIEIDSGEIHKTLDTCDGVWNALSELGADRSSLLINLGGGVITDLGGFIAATYKRGIRFINVPTTLLAMVDASIGGKTGVDLGSLKNQVGVFAFSEMVLVDIQFLNTLPYNELRSGFAEMLKHGLIADKTYWEKLITIDDIKNINLSELIYHSISIKYEVVKQDPKENGQRKILNFGHTLGHAIESYYLIKNKIEPLLHGEAIALGMVLEAYISHKKLGFPKERLNELKTYIIDLYGKIEINNDDIDHIISLLKFDKKNAFGDINFVLLKEISEPQIDCTVSNDIIINSFKYYLT